MKPFQKFLMVSSLIITVCFALLAGILYWEFYFGDCKDGCAGGMAFVLLLPSLIIAGASGVFAGVLYYFGHRKQPNQK